MAAMKLALSYGRSKRKLKLMGLGGIPPVPNPLELGAPDPTEPKFRDPTSYYKYHREKSINKLLPDQRIAYDEAAKHSRENANAVLATFQPITPFKQDLGRAGSFPEGNVLGRAYGVFGKGGYVKMPHGGYHPEDLYTPSKGREIGIGDRESFTSTERAAPSYARGTEGGVREDGFEGVTGKESNFNLAGLAGAVPYATNILNAFRKLPQVPTPQLQQSIGSPELVNFEDQVVETDRTLRGVEVAANTSNPSLGIGRRSTSLATLLGERNKLRMAAKNINADAINRNKQFNAIIDGNNARTITDYKRAKTERSIAQQRLQTENLANLSDKAQMNRRENRQFELEERKLKLLPKFYDDTGAFNRQAWEEFQKELQGLSKRGNT